jgi:hypothetical protein
MVLPGGPVAGPHAGAATPRPPWVLVEWRKVCVSAARRGSQARVVDPRRGAGAPRRRSDRAASLGDLCSARDLRVGRRRRRQAPVVDPRPLGGRGPSQTKPRRGLLGPSVRCDRSSVGRRRGSQARVVDPRPGAGAPRRRSDPAASLGDLWSARDLRVGRRRRRQALVVDPRPLRGRGPSPTKPRRGLFGPSVRCDRSSVGRWRGSQPCAPIPEQKTLGAPRRARDPATTSTPREQRRERRR